MPCYERERGQNALGVITKIDHLARKGILISYKLDAGGEDVTVPYGKLVVEFPSAC
jgi:hypothetical protein